MRKTVVLMTALANVEKITATFYAYEPWQDPYKDEPFAVLPQPDHFGYRLKVELPAK